MKQALFAMALIGSLAATSARAEKLDIDHRLYPPLSAAMEHPQEGTIYYDASRQGRVFDRILVRGTSAERDWQEALEFLAAPRKGPARTPQEWFAAFRPESESPCPAQVTRLGEDATSLTFELKAPACQGTTPLTGLYRVVYGRKTIYLVGAKYRGTMSATQREQWLALLNSAHLSG